MSDKTPYVTDPEPGIVTHRATIKPCVRCGSSKMDVLGQLSLERVEHGRIVSGPTNARGSYVYEIQCRACKLVDRLEVPLVTE